MRPIITLLTPSGAPGGYYAEEGWAPAAGASVKLPDATSVWTLDQGSTTLTATTPVSMSWDNGAGLVFHRTFAVDEDYVFTIKQSVDNKTDAAVTLFPYAQVTRHGVPPVDNVN